MTLYKCLRCNEPMEEYSVSFQGTTTPVGRVCMKEGCERYGLIAITAKVENIIEG